MTFRLQIYIFLLDNSCRRDNTTLLVTECMLHTFCNQLCYICRLIITVVNKYCKGLNSSLFISLVINIISPS